MKPVPCTHPLGERCKYYVCWLFDNDLTYNKLWGGDGVLHPWIWASSDSQRVVSNAGEPLGHDIEPKERSRRLGICSACEHYVPGQPGKYGKCKQCGCQANGRECPLHKWDIQEVVDAKQQIREIPPGKWPEGFHARPEVEAAFTELLTDRAHKPEYYPVERYGAGRGIVIGAGGIKYFTCAWVCASILRWLGCKLPIQFWYLGKMEMDPHMVRIASKLGVECVDAREMEKKFPARILAGWELKPYAVLYSKFDEVMFLDADNVAVNDPTYLFDDPRYADKGAIFWPDLPPNDRKEWVPQVVWKNFGIPYSKATAFESGQLLVNKEKCWRELNLCMWINEHSDYYYKQVYGDKDTWLMAWQKMAHVTGRKPQYAITNSGAGWISGGNGGAITQYDLDDRLIFQHRCRPYPDKWSLHASNPRIEGFVHEDRCLEALIELKGMWRATMWHNYHPSEEEKAFAKSLTGKTFFYERAIPGEQGRKLEILGGSGAGGRVGKGSAECEVRWEIFIIDGVVNLALCREDRLTCLLVYDGQSWTGAWEEHERCMVSLRETDAG